MVEKGGGVKGGYEIGRPELVYRQGGSNDGEGVKGRSREKRGVRGEEMRGEGGLWAVWTLAYKQENHEFKADLTKRGKYLLMRLKILKENSTGDKIPVYFCFLSLFF